MLRTKTRVRARVGAGGAVVDAVALRTQSLTQHTSRLGILQNKHNLTV